MKSNIDALLPDHYYHIYNRGINGCVIFNKDRHFQFFLEKYSYHVSPFVDTYAYCLLGNHFHMLVRIKSDKEIQTAARIKYPTKTIDDLPLFVSRQFSHLFNGYAQTFNMESTRTGALFEKPFRRVNVDSDVYFSRLVSYIHQNPEQHGLIDDFRKYRYSSYLSHISTGSTKLNRKEVLRWFGNETEYVKFHEDIKVDRDLNKFLIEV